jgi:uncharacterized hydrophobic protein (TIGR00271 family)
MLHLRILTPDKLADSVIEVLEEDPCVSGLAVIKSAAIHPPGDLVLADVAREAANDVIDRLRAIGVHREGTIEVQPVSTWLSGKGFECELKAPGSSRDAVVWAEVAQRSYEESELNWTYLSFMTLATVIGVALVRRRFVLFGHAIRTLILGFLVAIVVTTVLALIGRALGWITLDDVVGPRPATAFIYTPDKWSFIVAVVAATAGVLSLTSAKASGLAGVFISVTTVPAAGNIALGITFGVGDAIWGSTLQLLLNLSGMALAGWVALALQQAVWSRVSIRRAKAMARPKRML